MQLPLLNKHTSIDGRYVTLPYYRFLSTPSHTYDNIHSIAKQHHVGHDMEMKFLLGGHGFQIFLLDSFLVNLLLNFDPI